MAVRSGGSGFGNTTVQINFTGQEKIDAIENTINRISRGTDFHKYWRSVDSLVQDATRSMKAFSSSMSDIDATELVKVMNALRVQASYEGKTFKDLFPDNFDGMVSSFNKAVSQIGAIANTIDVSAFAEAFNTMNLFKVDDADVDRVRALFNALSMTGDIDAQAKALEELKKSLHDLEDEYAKLSREYENSRKNSGVEELEKQRDSLLEEIRQLKEDQKYELLSIRTNARREFDDYLSANKIDSDSLDYRAYDKYEELIEQIKDGTMTSAQAIAAFRTQFIGLFNEGNFDTSALEAFSTTLGDTFRKVEEIYAKVDELSSKIAEGIKINPGSFQQNSEEIKKEVTAITTLIDSLIEKLSAPDSDFGSGGGVSKTLTTFAEALNSLKGLSELDEGKLGKIQNLVFDLSSLDNLKFSKSASTNLQSLFTSINGLTNVDGIRAVAQLKFDWIGNLPSEGFGKSLSGIKSLMASLAGIDASSAKAISNLNFAKLKELDGVTFDVAGITGIINAGNGAGAAATNYYKLALALSSIAKSASTISGSGIDINGGIGGQGDTNDRNAGKLKKEKYVTKVKAKIAGTEATIRNLEDAGDITVNGKSMQGQLQSARNDLDTYAKAVENSKKISTKSLSEFESKYTIAVNKISEASKKLADARKASEEKTSESTNKNIISSKIDAEIIKLRDLEKEYASFKNSQDPGKSQAYSLLDGQLKQLEEWRDGLLGLKGLDPEATLNSASNGYKTLTTRVAEATTKLKSFKEAEDEAAKSAADSAKINEQKKILQARVDRLRESYKDSEAEARKYLRDDLGDKYNTYSTQVGDRDQNGNASGITDRIGNAKTLEGLKQIELELKAIESQAKTTGGELSKVVSANEKAKKSTEKAKADKDKADKAAFDLEQKRRNVSATLTQKENELRRYVGEFSTVGAGAKDLKNLQGNLTAVGEELKKVGSADSKGLDGIKTKLHEISVEASNTVKNLRDIQKDQNAADKRKILEGTAEYSKGLGRLESGLRGVIKMQKEYSATQSKGSTEARNTYEEVGLLAGKYRSFIKELSEGGVSAGDFAKKEAELSEESKRLGLQLEQTGVKGKTFTEIFAGSLKGFAQYFSATRVVMAAYRSMNQMVSESIAINDAMTQLQIVTKASDDTMAKFGQTAFDSAKKLGVAATDVISATTTYARLGNTMEEAAKMAELTTMLQTVGDIEAADAQSAITAIVKAYEVGVDDLESVMDRLVAVGNGAPISVSELATGLNNASSALKAAGNNFNESVALMTAANATIQDASKASTGLRTITARIRNVKSELEDLGEEALTEAKYDEIVQALTHITLEDGTTKSVSLTKSNGELKSTYEIIKEIAEVWDRMSSMDQAALAEKLAGKYCPGVQKCA